MYLEYKQIYSYYVDISNLEINYKDYYILLKLNIINEILRLIQENATFSNWILLLFQNAWLFDGLLY